MNGNSNLERDIESDLKLAEESINDELDAEIQADINECIHTLADVKAPTEKEFNLFKKQTEAKVILSELYLGFTNSEDIVYDVVFEYEVDNIIYRSRMQTKNKYNVGDHTIIYYYKKDPEYISEYDGKSKKEPYLLEIIIFVLMLLIASVFIIKLKIM